VKRLAARPTNHCDRAARYPCPVGTARVFFVNTRQNLFRESNGGPFEEAQPIVWVSPGCLKPPTKTGFTEPLSGETVVKPSAAVLRGPSAPVSSPVSPRRRVHTDVPFYRRRMVAPLDPCADRRASPCAPRLREASRASATTNIRAQNRRPEGNTVGDRAAEPTGNWPTGRKVPHAPVSCRARRFRRRKNRPGGGTYWGHVPTLMNAGARRWWVEHIIMRATRNDEDRETAWL